jgi:hypothetical protein
MRLDRAAAHVGERLCTFGRDFGTAEPITVGTDGIAVAQTMTSAVGTFTSCFAAPGSIVAGPNDVSAAGASSGRIASARFTGILPVASTAYFVGASTAGGDDTTVAILNARSRPAAVTLHFYLPRGSAPQRTLTVKAHSRATLTLSRYVRGLRGFGLSVQANRVVAAQMIVSRGRADPYTALGSGLLSGQWYLAEGYTNLTFRQTLYALNPGTRAAHLVVHLLPANGRNPRTVRLTAAPGRPIALDVNRAYPHVALAALVFSDAQIMVQRVLTFGAGSYGATGNSGSIQAATTWLFADGGTAHGLQTFLTVLNPGRRPARVRVRLVDTKGHQVGSQAMTVDALHRGTLRLNDVASAEAFAAFVTGNQPVGVERPFYTGNPNRGRTGGSIVFGRNGTGRSWIFPGGDTTHGRQEYLLLLNPGATACQVRATFYLANGRSLARTVRVPAHARYTIDVRRDLPALRNTLHGALLVSTTGVGFIAEQSIYDEGRSAGYSTAGLAQ